MNAQKQYGVYGHIDEWEARFLLMTDYWMLQTDALGQCNKQLLQLRNWTNQHRNLEK